MMKFSASLLLVQILMFTITSSQTTINNIITTLSHISIVAAESTISTENDCIELLTEFAVCSPYISSNPNNLTTEEVPPASCCNLYRSYATEGSTLCLCHFVKEPFFRGVQVNMTRLYALSTFCPFLIPPSPVALEVQCKEIAPRLSPLGSILAPSGSPSESSGSPPADEAPMNSSTSSPTNRDIESKI